MTRHPSLAALPPTCSVTTSECVAVVQGAAGTGQLPGAEPEPRPPPGHRPGTHGLGGLQGARGQRVPAAPGLAAEVG